MGKDKGDPLKKIFLKMLFTIILFTANKIKTRAVRGGSRARLILYCTQEFK